MRPDITNIKNIIFDLGKVILNLDFEASEKAFRSMGRNGQIPENHRVFSDPLFYELETGKISPEEFRERVRQLLQNPGLADREIDDAWYAMIRDIPKQRVDTLLDLSQTFHIFLFSNTNKIHIDRLHADFRKHYGFEFSSLFVRNFYSHEIRERKPNVNAFVRVIDMSGINPEETIFVDDLEQNIEGAKMAGLKTFWLKDYMEMAEVFSVTNLFRV